MNAVRCRGGKLELGFGAVCASVGRRLQARNLGGDRVLAVRLRTDRRGEISRRYAAAVI